MENNDNVTSIENRIKDLPLIDASVFEIISLLNDPDSNFQQIVKKISADIAARFLNMANSAYYGRKVSSIDHAVRLLGYSEMKQILITSILIDHLTKHLDFENFNFDRFQRQSHFCAAVCKILGDVFEYPKPQDLFTVAILHNIGKLVIAVYFKEDHKKIIALKKAEGISSHEAELRILGVTHSQIGALVLEKFQIAKNICEAVRFHDSKDRVIPEEMDYQLELILRESAAIVADFSLPEESDPLDIVNEIRTTIQEAKKEYRKEVSTEIISRGYRELFPSMLKHACEVIRVGLSQLLRKRVPDKKEGEDENH
ncbi:MAG: HDOD domain-containing protein [Deltaproteobacteria bacterium]|nr:HDOD domain-containing protein [Deltaproteobacteria bacterium]